MLDIVISETFSFVKHNISPFSMGKNILNELISPSQKDRHCMTPLTRGRAVKFIETEHRMVFARDYRKKKCVCVLSHLPVSDFVTP